MNPGQIISSASYLCDRGLHLPALVHRGVSSCGQYPPVPWWHTGVVCTVRPLERDAYCFGEKLAFCFCHAWIHPGFGVPLQQMSAEEFIQTARPVSLPSVQAAQGWEVALRATRRKSREYFL